MKRYLAFIVLAALLIFTVGCAPRTLQIKIEDASKLTVFSGSSGKHLDITDEQTISNITDSIVSHTYTRDRSSKYNDGFSYILTWYDANGEKLEELAIMTESRISYNDHFYDKEECNSELPVAELEKLFSQDITE